MMIKRICETKSLSVDSISGATVTSAAVKQAISNAIINAGGKQIDFIKQKCKYREKENTFIETDVVVVGAGIAGFCAAIEALDNVDYSQ